MLRDGKKCLVFLGDECALITEGKSELGSGVAEAGIGDDG